MRHHGALGRTGGTGGEDRVRRSVAVHVRGSAVRSGAVGRRGLARQWAAVLTEGEERDGQVGRGTCAVGDEQGDTGCADHVAHPLGRISRIDRHVGRTRPHDSEHRRHRLGAACHAYPDEVAVPHARTPHGGAHPLCHLVECAVADLAGAVGHGDGVGVRALAVLCDQVVHPGRRCGGKLVRHGSSSCSSCARVRASGCPQAATGRFESEGK